MYPLKCKDLTSRNVPRGYLKKPLLSQFWRKEKPYPAQEKRERERERFLICLHCSLKPDKNTILN